MIPGSTKPVTANQKMVLVKQVQMIARRVGDPWTSVTPHTNRKRPMHNRIVDHGHCLKHDTISYSHCPHKCWRRHGRRI